ncbi:MAG: phage tail sheath subtilisin-like domain-containing protein [Bacillota bacterium]|nr:phage tail sheath subtilisin-like domain-containing protein [Bacillota bacterium]
MALEYIVPRVAIDESDVGPRPTPAVSLAGIGLVGTFCRGPVNTPVTVGSLEQLISVFGEHKPGLTGYLSARGAFHQGANDLKVVRIGAASIKAASLILKDSANIDSVKVEANTPGTWGNDIMVAVVAGTTANTFKLIVTYGSQAETFDNLTLDNLGNVKSRLIVASKVAGATQIPANIASTPLAGGDDGATTADSDYIGTIDADGRRSGLKALDPVRVAIVLCAQQHSEAIRAALIAHCAAATIGQGLRIAVLNTPPGLTPDAAGALTGELDSMRAVMAYPWLEPLEEPGTYVAPDGYYAGRLAVLASQQSPSNKEIVGILGTERLCTDAEVKTLTLARISPITLVPNRGYRIRNGLNLSSDPAWSQTNLRRAFDQLEMEIYDATQWAISEENTPKLRAAVADQLDALLSIKKAKGEIYDYKPTICDDTNNTPESIAARILNTTVRVRAVYAADYIDHRVQRLLA